MDHQELIGLLRYEPDTGQFFWRVNRRGGCKSGDVAGSFDAAHRGQRYWRIMVFRKRCAAHRLAWFYVHGRWPDSEIDHINGDALDNRICNLREVGRFGNAQNLRKARVDSEIGLIGVRRRRSGRFQAVISAYGNRLSVGTYSTPQEAHAAYVASKRIVHSTCTI